MKIKLVVSIRPDAIQPANLASSSEALAQKISNYLSLYSGLNE